MFRRLSLLLATLAALLTALPTPGLTQDFEQEVLGPGLYIFQTRVRGATCNDDFRTGYVTSFFASVDGVPGERSMQMTLLNSPYWPTWQLKIDPDGQIAGIIKIDGDGPRASRESRFSAKKDSNRFTGVGSRSYWSQISGQWRRCTVHFDVLLRRFDVN